MVLASIGELPMKMTGGQALVKSLGREGVRVIFGIPGVQLYHVMDALYDDPEITFITTRHEQAAAYMADGYSRAGGGIGTAMVVPGPGLLNASAGIGTAYAASSPILVVSGQVPRDSIGAKLGELHEVDDQLEAIKPITKWSRRVLHAADIPAAVKEAFRQLGTGRPRPVEIEIVWDALPETTEIELLETTSVTRPCASLSDVQKGVEVLLTARSPAILAGRGVIASGASGILVQVAEHLQTPVFTTLEGKGSISDRHPLSVGINYRSEIASQHFQRCDVILAVGTMTSKVEFGASQRVVQIDIDCGEIRRSASHSTVGLVGDAKATLEALYRAISQIVPARCHPSEETKLARAQRFERKSRVEPQYSIVRAIRAALPDDAIIVEGVTQIGYASRYYYEVYEPGTYLTSSYFGNLGYAYPLALGAKVAQPGRTVVAISGDGGFLYNSQELATAVKYGINAIVIVFNDNAYGNVLRDQVNRFEGRIIGSKLHNPDFVKLAEAYGAMGIKTAGPQELGSALERAILADVPVLIEVPVGPMPSPW